MFFVFICVFFISIFGSFAFCDFQNQSESDCKQAESIESIVAEQKKLEERLSQIQGEKKKLRGPTYKRENELKINEKEWLNAIEKYNLQTTQELSKRLEILEIKERICKLKKEKDFIKKYESLGECKARLNKLKNTQNEMKAGKAKIKASSEEIFGISYSKKMKKINRERKKLERIMEKDYAFIRLEQIKRDIAYLTARSGKLKKDLLKPKNYNEIEIRKNLKDVRVTLNDLRVDFHERMRELNKEQEILTNKIKELQEKVDFAKNKEVKSALQSLLSNIK